MEITHPRIETGMVEAMLDETISEADLDLRFAEGRDEINTLLQEAYDAKARGDSAPLEPLHVLLAEERARFIASQG